MERKTKQTSKAKIDKMVADGARNYPAYLKLIYTGESELSSEDEFSTAQGRSDVRISRTSPVVSCRSLASCFDSTSDGNWKTDSTCSESAKLKDEGREKISTPSSDSVAGSVKYNDIDTHDPIHEQDSLKLEKEKELFQIQEEISSLKSLLETKVALANQLKKKLGFTPMSEFKLSIRNLKHSETFLKTNAALRSLSNLASKTIGNWRISSPFTKQSTIRENGYIKQSQSLGNMYEQSDPSMYSSATSLKLPTCK